MTHIRKLLHFVKPYWKRSLLALISRIPQQGDCGCADALGSAIQTASDAVSPEAAKQLGLIYQRYAK